MAVPSRSSGFNSLCSLLDQPPVVLRRNESSNELYFDELTHANGTNVTRQRRLQTTATPAISAKNRQLQQVAAVVRSCPCSLDLNNPFFCEIKYDVCELTRNGSVLCWKSSVKRFVGNLLPFIMFWIVFLLFMMGITHRGRLARAYLKRVLCRDTVEQQLDRMRRDQPNRVHQLVHDYELRMFRTRQRMEANAAQPGVVAAAASTSDDADSPPLESGLAPGQPYLVLRTKVFTTSKEGTTADVDEDQSCSICLGTLQEGMRIGSLMCHHEFHVDCLKTWLLGKNHCPLCNQQVAELRVNANETPAPADGTP
ncbi:hypothetical protein MHU86_1100 [Fragilaria crotonensis]|nr:hypothetical protein MHU86_1100 [Fragilaria crotonensis]